MKVLIRDISSRVCVQKLRKFYDFLEHLNLNQKTHTTLNNVFMTSHSNMNFIWAFLGSVPPFSASERHGLASWAYLLTQILFHPAGRLQPNQVLCCPRKKPFRFLRNKKEGDFLPDWPVCLAGQSRTCRTKLSLKSISLPFSSAGKGLLP